MSNAIAVRTCGDQLVEVPPMELSWASEHPRLVELVDLVGGIMTGAGAGQSTAENLGVFAEFAREVAKVSGFEGELRASVVDVARMHAALRGVEAPDPTEPRPAG